MKDRNTYDLADLERAYGLTPTKPGRPHGHYVGRPPSGTSNWWADDDPRFDHTDETPPLTSDQVLAAHADVDERTIRRWRRDGLTADRADQLATALGLPTAYVWPDWTENTPEDLDELNRTA